MRKSTDSAGVQVLMAAAVGIAAGKLLQRARQADISGQIALIMGGSRGLGLELARAFAHAGCTIAITARDEIELDSAAHILRQDGIEVFAIPCNVARQAEVDNVIEAVTQQFGRIDILVNNAAIMVVGPVTSMRMQDFKDAMDVMHWGIVYATLAVMPQMRERRYGRIVNITSIGGRLSVPHMLPYSAAKFAAVGFSEGMHSELMRDGIHVTTIVPGLMRTGGTTRAFFKGDQEGEFTWLNLADSLPISSMSARRAALETVRATRRGDAVHTLSMPAKLASKFHGLFPGVTAHLMGYANMLILPSDDSREAEPGLYVLPRIQTIIKRLISMNTRAAVRLNQFSNPPERDAKPL